MLLNTVIAPGLSGIMMGRGSPISLIISSCRTGNIINRIWRNRFCNGNHCMCSRTVHVIWLISCWNADPPLGHLISSSIYFTLLILKGEKSRWQFSQAFHQRLTAVSVELLPSQSERLFLKLSLSLCLVPLHRWNELHEQRPRLCSHLQRSSRQRWCVMRVPSWFWAGQQPERLYMYVSYLVPVPSHWHTHTHTPHKLNTLKSGRFMSILFKAHTALLKIL